MKGMASRQASVEAGFKTTPNFGALYPVYCEDIMIVGLASSRRDVSSEPSYTHHGRSEQVDTRGVHGPQPPDAGSAGVADTTTFPRTQRDHRL